MAVPRPWGALPLLAAALAAMRCCAGGLQSPAGAAALTAAGAASSTAPANPFTAGELRFRPDGTFKILQLTDLHYGEDAALDALTDQVWRGRCILSRLSCSPCVGVDSRRRKRSAPLLPAPPSRPQVQRTVLAAERPGLVVFSGDMVSGWVCSAQRKDRPAACGPGWFEARWRQLIAPVHAAGLPYAVLLGNHE